VEGHRRQREDTSRGTAQLSSVDPKAQVKPRPWRVAVTEGSMAPAIMPGDWLVVNPRVSRWPRKGAVVVFREPLSETLAIKRVAAGPGEQVRFGGGFLTLAADEAWLTADADEKAAAAVGFGPPIDSNRYGPVPLDDLVARVLFRYAPLRRFGRIPDRSLKGAPA
jgi:signal peptidase S26 family